MVKRIVQKAPQRGAKRQKTRDAPLRRSTRVRKAPDYFHNYQSPPRVRAQTLPRAQIINPPVLAQPVRKRPVPKPKVNKTVVRKPRRQMPIARRRTNPQFAPVIVRTPAFAPAVAPAVAPAAIPAVIPAVIPATIPAVAPTAIPAAYADPIEQFLIPPNNYDHLETQLEGFDVPHYKRGGYNYDGYANEDKYMPYKFDGSSRYDDDELLNLDPQSRKERDAVSLSVAPVYNKFDASSPQEIPCMISLKANDRQDQQSRLGMDVICVIDISGSMFGTPIEQVIATLRFVLDLLGDKDRLCLIVFDHRAFRLCPLTRVNAEGRIVLLNIINNIFVLIHNEIEEGLRCALFVLKDRRIQNDITSVLLLSDGCDSINKHRIDYLKAKSDEIGLKDYFIHTFGYGSFHNPAILKEIADKNDGNFYYVEKINDVAPAFASCIGELATIVVEKPEVLIIPVASPMNCTLLKVYSENGDAQFCMPSLLSSDRNDSIFVVGVDAQGEEGEISPIKVQVRLKMAQTKREIVLEDELTLEFVNMMDNIEMNEEVLVNFYRVKGAEILKEIGKLADMNLFERAQKLSTDGVYELKNSLVRDNYIIKALIDDLDNARQRASSSMEWNRGGKAEVVSVTENHAKQKGAINSQQYMNSVQASFVSQSQQI